MPGFGGSERAAHFEYTVEGFARHLDAVMTHFGVSRSHLVLHDFGGPWGLAGPRPIRCAWRAWC